MKFITAARQWGKSLLGRLSNILADKFDAVVETAEERMEAAAVASEARELAVQGFPIDPAFGLKQREAAVMYARAHAPRAVRRALRYSHSRLPKGWAMFFDKFPEAEQAVRRG